MSPVAEPQEHAWLPDHNYSSDSTCDPGIFADAIQETALPETIDRDDRATVLIAVTTSSVAFIVAFNFGAFDTVFFNRISTVWVISTVVLVASFVTSVGPKTWTGRLALLLPTLWIALQSLTVTGLVSIDDNVINWFAAAVTGVALPFLAYALVGAVNPAYIDLPQRNKRAIIISVLVFAGIGAVMGVRNDLFLTCEDFEVSGNDQPVNCRKAPGEASTESPSLGLLVSESLNTPWVQALG